jgi:hypothetical protein
MDSHVYINAIRFDSGGKSYHDRHLKRLAESKKRNEQERKNLGKSPAALRKKKQGKGTHKRRSKAPKTPPPLGFVKAGSVAKKKASLRRARTVKITAAAAVTEGKMNNMKMHDCNMHTYDGGWTVATYGHDFL